MVDVKGRWALITGAKLPKNQEMKQLMNRLDEVDNRLRKHTA